MSGVLAAAGKKAATATRPAAAAASARVRPTASAPSKAASSSASVPASSAPAPASTSMPTSAAATPAPSVAVDDDPCWGGPEPHRHDLGRLLRVLASGSEGGREREQEEQGQEKEEEEEEEEGTEAWIERIRRRIVLFQDDDYVAINKPADLRMDGPHRATVHKLLLYLFPPPSLRRTDGDSGSRRRDRHLRLLRSVALLSKRNNLREDPHRAVHQLDYATSGVLLFGKNRRAAGVASQAFERRETDKRYVAAATRSRSDPNRDEPPFGRDFFASLPRMNPSCLDAWKDGSLEGRYRRKRRLDAGRKGGTFDGYMPAHSVFERWRAQLVRERREAAKDAKEEVAEGGTRSEGGRGRRRRRGDDPALPRPRRALDSTEIDEMLSLGRSYKKVRTHCARTGRDWTAVVEAMAEEYNRSLAELHTRKGGGDGGGESDLADGGIDSSGDATMDRGAPNLPPLFVVQREDGSDGGTETSERPPSSSSTFYICAAIGEADDGRFQVVLDPSAASTSRPTGSPPPSPLPKLRPSLTECTVLWRGRCRANDHEGGGGRGVPVAKVALRPHTGRRHQLRVHLANAAGCPILGDEAYGGGVRGRGEEEACRRMCLHARELRVPLMGGRTRTFEARDPFVTTGVDDCKDALLTIL
ncbi:hypothetical protein ACHAWF_013226 [Thalassiosira exigua]